MTCLSFNILATTKVISRWAPTCNSAFSWQLYSAAQLGNQTIPMTWYHTHSQYPDAESTSPCPILLMLSSWLGSDKYKFYKSLVWFDHRFKPTISHMRDPCSTDLATMPSGWVTLTTRWSQTPIHHGRLLNNSSSTFYSLNLYKLREITHADYNSEQPQVFWSCDCPL